MSQIVIESKTKRSQSEITSDILRHIKAGARTKSKIKSYCRLSGSAVNKYLALLEQAGEVETGEDGLLYATKLGEILNKKRAKIEPKLAWLRRTPNQKAADRTKDKSDAELSRRRKNFTPCNCKLYEMHVPHSKCYYEYDNGWLVESAQKQRLERICKPLLDELASLTANIDARYKSRDMAHGRYSGTMQKYVNNAIAERSQFLHMHGAKFRALERAQARYEIAEQSLNNLTPHDKELEAQILASWF